MRLKNGKKNFVKQIIGIRSSHTLKKYDPFTLNTTSCFWGSTTIVQFHESFVTKIMNNKLFFIIKLWKQKFREIAQFWNKGPSTYYVTSILGKFDPPSPLSSCVMILEPPLVMTSFFKWPPPLLKNLFSTFHFEKLFDI